MPRTDVTFGSLLAATDVDVLPDTAIVEDRGRYVVVRTPSNPGYHWGNFLLFRQPPVPGDRERWETAFVAEFGAERAYWHCALCWEPPGDDGAAVEEFIESGGYDADRAVALVATPDELVDHPRSNRHVTIHVLDPDGDAETWHDVVELQVAAREPAHAEAPYREFAVQRMEDRRERFRAGDGAWLVARTPAGELAASCGLVVTNGRCRFQAVDTFEPHRRQGIATRLVHDAGRLAIDRFDADHLVIGADANYHALPLYESLGFTVRERSLAVNWWPGAARAAVHPTWGERARDVR